MESQIQDINKKPKVKPYFSIKTYQKILISNYGTLFDLQFYNNKSQVICSGNDHEISFWNMETRKCEQTLKGHTNTITTLCESKENSKRFVTTSSDKSVKIWDVYEKKKLPEEPEPQEKKKTIKKKEEINYDILNIENPDNKSTIGVTFLDKSRIIFGQCLNKAHIYNLDEKRIEFSYTFDQGAIPEEQQGAVITENHVYKDHSQQNSYRISLEEQQEQEKQQKKEVPNKEQCSMTKSGENNQQQQKPKQSWVTSIEYFEEFGIILLCENSRIHILDSKTYKVLQIFDNTHGGHILQIKVYKNFILMGSSDSLAYLYQLDKLEEDKYQLTLKLKLKSHRSSCANIDFWFENRQDKIEEFHSKYDIQGLPKGGIICSAFDPNAKFFSFDGQFLFNVDNVASPIIWDSENSVLVGRDYNITREIAIQKFE